MYDPTNPLAGSIRMKEHEPERKHPEPKKPEDPKKPAEPVKEPQTEDEPEVSTQSVPIDRLQAMLTAVIAEARKPVPNEREVARVKRMRDHNRMMQKDQRQQLIGRFYSCNHMQSPGSVMTGCAAIAWATQSDGRKRGVCQHCGTVFSSERSECLAKEVWDAYKMLVRLPTHPAGNINNVFQSA